MKKVRPLRRTMFLATVLIVLYGLSLPVLALGRLLRASRATANETLLTGRAFTSLVQQTAILQNAAALALVLNESDTAVSVVYIDSLERAVRNLRAAPRAEYGELSEQMRGAFASSIERTDLFTASLDEAVRAARLGETALFSARIRSALARVPDIRRAQDEAQRQGSFDLLNRQQRMRNAGSELVYWTIAWLVAGALLLWYLANLTRVRLLNPLDDLERGLTQLSDGDLEARVSETGDELGRLANVFNRASDVLRRRAEEQGRFAAAGQLLADVAHEVNNPLMAILGTAETALAYPTLDREMRMDLELVRDQSRRAGKLLSGLLRFVRVAEETEDVVELQTVVARAIDLMAYQFPVHRIECRTHYDSATAPVRTAAIRLEQVLVNVLTNAVHAMQDMPGARVLDVQVWSRDGFSYVSVRDSGPGVSTQMIDRLFQPFATTKGDRGTGLGLYICRRIARESGGDLKYEETTSGAQFTLSLPSCITPRAVSAIIDAPARPAASVLAGLNILLVDDEAGVRKAIARYLRRGGAAVREAANGLDALTLVENEEPDVVLLDLRMPVMDGYEFISRIRESNAALVTRVLVFSGDLAAGNADNAPVAPDRMLAKPVSLADLAKRLHEVATASDSPRNS